MIPHIDRCIDANDIKEIDCGDRSYAAFLYSDKVYSVDIEKQKTGYGEKLFIKCHNCNSRRTKLYLYKDLLLCRCCYPWNVYRKIQHVTVGGTDYITYKMGRFASKCGISFERHPFHYCDHEKPKYKHSEKYLLNLAILQALANMRMQSIFMQRIWDKLTIDSVLNGTNAALFLFELYDLDTYLINFDIYVDYLNCAL